MSTWQRRALLLILAPTLLMTGKEALAAGGPGVTFINYYEIILHKLGVEGHALHDWIAVVGGLVTLSALLLVGLLYSRAVAKAGDDVVPEKTFSIRTFVEGALDFIIQLANDVIGKERGAGYLPLLCGLFFFILFSNLSGLVPGFPPATESINTNLAMALIVFCVYQFAGLREHRHHYIKQFLGPVLLLYPLLFCIEIISHVARPLSLSLRLYGNIFGDHLVLSVFTGLTYLILPAALLFFGLLVAMLQSFVFTLLSSIYIAMAISHDH